MSDRCTTHRTRACLACEQTPDQSATEGMAKVIVAHRLVQGDVYGWTCRCGHKGTVGEHKDATHVAEALAAAGYAREDESQLAHWKRVAGHVREQAEGQEARAGAAEATLAGLRRVQAETVERYQAAESALAEQTAAMLGLADDMADPDSWASLTEDSFPWIVKRVRAAISDPTALDRVKADHGAKVLREAAAKADGMDDDWEGLSFPGAAVADWLRRKAMRIEADDE